VPVGHPSEPQVPASGRSDPTRRRVRYRRRPILRPKHVLVVADAVTIWIAVLAAHAVVATEVAGRGLIGISIIAPLVWIAMLKQHRLYSSRHVTQPAEELRRLTLSAFTTLAMLGLVVYYGSLEVDQTFLVVIAAFGLAGLFIERSIARVVFDRVRRSGRMRRRVVIVGTNDEARLIRTLLAADPSLGYQVVGFVDDSDLADHPVTAVDFATQLVDTVGEAARAVERSGASGVIIAPTAIGSEAANRLIRELSDAGLYVEVSSSLVDVASHRLMVRPLGRFSVLCVDPVARTGWRPAAKRAFDVVAASLGLAVLSPILLVAAVLIRRDGGPVLYRQERVGRSGGSFMVVKLRTMVPDAEARRHEVENLNEADGPLFKVHDDPRVTSVGRVLRKWSIDELPQLWNVLRGDMSLVGPRPALPSEAAEWPPELYSRLRVRPGITGMWQVSGRSETGFDEYVRLDLYYVDNWSLFTDVGILLKTIPAVMSRRGAF